MKSCFLFQVMSCLTTKEKSDSLKTHSIFLVTIITTKGSEAKTVKREREREAEMKTFTRTLYRQRKQSKEVLTQETIKAMCGRHKKRRRVKNDEEEKHIPFRTISSLVVSSSTVSSSSKEKKHDSNSKEAKKKT